MNTILPLTELPKGNAKGLLGFPLSLNLEQIDAHIAILGVPYGLPYYPSEMANDQSRAPDILRQNAQDAFQIASGASKRTQSTTCGSSVTKCTSCFENASGASITCSFLAMS